MKIIDGGITAPLGFAAAGKHIGLKKAKKDFSILFSHLPSVAAGVFTQNLIKAAPIVWSQAIVQKSSSVRAIVTNSGNANACTGEQGFKHTVETAQITAQQLGISAEEVLICSTGVIGVPLPVHTLVKGIPEVVKGLGSSRQH